MEATLLSLTVNGKSHRVAAWPNQTLATVLREQCGLTGTKIGCDMGTCGCCTVLLEGQPRLSCLTLALECEGREIETIEGLNFGADMHPLQRSFADCLGSQCGFCTPGFIMTSKHLLDEHPDPSLEQIQHALAGNLCRCTGYAKIYDAVRAAARELREAGIP